MDAPEQDGKRMLAERLKHFRTTAGISIPELEKKTGIRRSYLYRIEEGTANFSIDLFENLLKACGGVTLAECLSGLRTSTTPAEYEDLYDMLDVIVAGRIPRQTEGIRVNLEAISLNVQRLVKVERGSEKKPGPQRSSAIGDASNPQDDMSQDGGRSMLDPAKIVGALKEQAKLDGKPRTSEIAAVEKELAKTRKESRPKQRKKK